MGEIQDRSPLTEAVFYILLSVVEPLHGYGIMQQVKELSRGRVNLGAGTLYGAINTLLDKAWIVPEGQEVDSRKKSYKITGEGLRRIESELDRLKELLDNGIKIMEVQHEEQENHL